MQLLETAEARPQRGEAAGAVRGVAEPGCLQERVLLGVDADAHVVARAARVAVGLGAAVAAALVGAATRKAPRRAVVAGRDDAAVEHEHGADVASEALGALPRRDGEQHEVLVARRAACARAEIRTSRVEILHHRSVVPAPVTFAAWTSRCAAGSISGGRRSRRWSSGQPTVHGQARLATPVTGGPSAVVEQMVEAMREAATAAGVEPASLTGIGVGSPGAIDSEAGTVSHAGNLPGWEGRSPSPPRSRPRSACPYSWQRRRRRDARRVRARSGRPVPQPARRLLGHRGRRRPDPRREALGRPRVGGRDRPHGGAPQGRALHLRAARLPRGLRGPRLDGDPRAEAVRGGGSADPALQDHAAPRQAAPLERRLGRGARVGRQDGARPDGAGPARARGRRRLGDQPARRRGGRDRRRHRDAARAALRRQDPRGDAPAPVRRRPAADRADCVARRPRRRDRRDADRRPGACGGSDRRRPA